MLFLFPVLLVLLVVGVVVVVRRRHHPEQEPSPGQQARTLKQVAFGAMVVFTTLVGLFVVWETFADPGGWAAVGLVALWAVPLVALGLLAWRDPDLGLRLLGALVAVMVVLSVWFALDPQGWRDFEDSRGPVRTIATFALAAVIALLGLRRPGRAGLELVALSVVPPLISSFGTGAGMSSLLAVASVPLLAGVLFLASARLARHVGPPGRYGPAH